MGEVEPRVRAALDILFDPAWYEDRYVDHLQPGQDPLAHFLSAGASRRLSPHVLFDADWYAVRHGLSENDDAFAHFVLQGEREGSPPSPYFDVTWYRSANPDVAAAGVNSLVHYVEFGRAEGRLSSPMFDPTTVAPLRFWPLARDTSIDRREVLRLAPRPTTLSRLLRAEEATSFLDPAAVRQVLLQTRSLGSHRFVGEGLAIGGVRGVLHESDGGVLAVPGAEVGWALAHVTHAVAPSIDTAVHLLGLDMTRDTAQLERWAARVREAVGETSAPYLLVDEAMPAQVATRLISAAGPTSRAYRVPPGRLLAVQHLTLLDIEHSVDL